MSSWLAYQIIAKQDGRNWEEMARLQRFVGLLKEQEEMT